MAKISKEAFAKRVTQALREAGEGGAITFDAKSFELRIGGEKGTRLFLGNAYEEYCAAPPDDRDLVLRRYVRTGPEEEIPDRFEEALPHVVPRVRERVYFEFLRLRGEATGAPVPAVSFEPVAPHLAVSLAYDAPDTIMEVSDEQLKTWKLGVAAALERAKGTLAAMSRDGLEPVRPGLWRSPWQDNHDASRLVLLDFIRNHRVKGEPVAMVPNRDTLLLAGSEDAAALAAMAEIARGALEGPRAMTGIPVRLEKGRWTDWRPPAPVFERMRFESMARDYGEQKELLEALHERKEIDLFVATYTVVQPEGSPELLSYSVWTEGVDTLLPRTDRVALVRPSLPKKKRFLGLVEWDRVAAVAGARMKAEGTVPERWRVRTFPSDRELRQLFEE